MREIFLENKGFFDIRLMDYTTLTPSTLGMRRVMSDNISRWVLAHIRLMLAELIGRRP